MAIDYITDTRTQEQSVDTDQHLIVTATGSIVATSSDGIGISDPSTVHIQTSIYGSVYGQLKGIAFGTSDTTAFIGETGIVEGGVTGFETGENGVVTNNGQIKGGLQGILANYINASITNGGSVVGSVGIEGDFDFGDNTRFTNTGTVTGLSHGVLLYRNSLITNDGIIQALGGNASIGISVKTFQDVFDPDANVATVTNRGTIIGDYAIEGDSGVEQITNLGTLQGKVALLDGDDLYDGRGGFVSGIVDLGDGADTAFGGDGTEQMLGGNGDDRLSGGGGADILSGGTGSDRLDGGTGADEMTGGDDDDTYVVDDAGDVVTETANGGTDTVESSISHILADSVENLVLTGSADLSGIGNAAANVIVGNSGNNYLDGAAGADDLRGGAGNDTYVVDDAADAVTEVADGGIDTVQASVSFTLAANVENLHLTGAGDIDGSGNALANIINGNAGNNVLDGGGGADQLRGGAGNDTYVVDHESDAVFEMAGDGVDTVQASISFTLAADVENLSLTGTGAINGTGNAQANIVTGNAGDNLLDGGAGADALSGGGGGDTYIVDNAGDTVAEAANEGDDTVRASVSFTLGADIENLILTGSANIAGAGNGLANVLIGNTGNNILTGAGGDDQIDGGEGHDTALFSGQSSDYEIIVNLDGTVNVNGADGNDTLRSIESLRFDDGTFSVKFPAAPTVVGSVAPINENAPANTVVATLHANTLAGESVRYVLDDDIDGKFAIDASTGVITLIGAVDYEADFQDDPNLMTTADGLRKYYVLQVKAVSADGLALSSATVPLNVYVNNVNEAPATLSFTDGSTTATVDGAVGNGAVVGTLMASDPDGDTQLVYSFDSTGNGNSSGAGNAGGLFKIEGGKLKFARTPSATDPESYTVTLKVTDKNGGPGATSYYKDFLINFNPGDTPPTPNELSIAPQSATHAEGNSGFTDFTFVVSRANASGDTDVTWSIATNSTITAADFEDVTGTVNFTGTATTQVVTVRVRGDVNIEGNEAFTIGLTNAQGGTVKIGGGTAVGTITNDDQPSIVNGGPTGITLSGPGIAGEYAAAGFSVGTLIASDPNTGDTFSYALLDDAQGRFAIAGDQLVVKNGFKLDFEQATSHQVVVRVTDQSGASFDRAMTIGVADMNPEFTLGSADNDIFKGGAGNDTLGGGAGDDILWGGLGKDVLTGAAGRDIFVFNTKPNKKTNLDKIVDFNVKDDSIWLDNAVFKKLGKKGSEASPGKLSKAFFTVGKEAKDRNDYLVYDKKKAVLYYDSDGSGKAKAVEIATLKKNLKMTYKDFFII